MRRQRRPHGRFAISPFWVVLAVAILVSSVPRLGYGTWIWRAGSRAAVTASGAPLEWEWTDVAQSAWFAQGDPRWHITQGDLLSQNARRFVPGLIVSWLGAWTGSARAAAIVGTWLCWVTAAVTTSALCRALLPPVERGRRVGRIAAGLVALSPGFTAFFGNIDAHPFGYAAAPLALLALERGRLRRCGVHGAGPEPDHDGDHRPDDVLDRTDVAASILTRRSVQVPLCAGDQRHNPLVLGIVLFLANATLDLGPPLLVTLWVMYVGLESVYRRDELGERIRRAALITLVYATLQATWQVLAAAIASGRVAPYNDPVGVMSAMAAQADWVHWPPAFAGGRAREVLHVATASFTLPVVALFVPGLFVLPRRARSMALVWLVAITASVVVTRTVPRTLYLGFPALYITAAAFVEHVGTMLETRVFSHQAAAVRIGLRLMPAAVFLVLVGRLVLGDLAGDLTLPRSWWPA